MSDAAEVKCIFCGEECRLSDCCGKHYVVCDNSECEAVGPEKSSRGEAIYAFLNPPRIAGKPLPRTVAIGEARVRIEAGFLTPGVASFWARCKSSGKLETINEHATPSQLRELSALCLRSADEAEEAGREAGL